MKNPNNTQAIDAHDVAAFICQRAFMCNISPTFKYDNDRRAYIRLHMPDCFKGDLQWRRLANSYNTSAVRRHFREVVDRWVLGEANEVLDQVFTRGSYTIFVSKCLIHEDKTKGIDRYIKHLPSTLPDKLRGQLII